MHAGNVGRTEVIVASRCPHLEGVKILSSPVLSDDTGLSQRLEFAMLIIDLAFHH